MLDFVKWQQLKQRASQDVENVEFTSMKGSDYIAQIFAFAERWAHLMDEQIAKGETVEHVAEATSYLADEEVTEGVSLIMYQQAVQLLVYAWDRGQELRVWHNQRFADDTVHPGIFCCDTIRVGGGKRAAIIASYGDLRDAGIVFWEQLRQQVAERVANEKGDVNVD